MSTDKLYAEEIMLTAEDEVALDRAWASLEDEEDGETAEKEYRPVRDDPNTDADGHWITTGQGKHVFIANSKMPEGANAPQHQTQADLRRISDDMRLEINAEGGSVGALNIALDSFLSDPTTNEARWLRAQSVKRFGGTAYYGEANDPDEILSSASATERDNLRIGFNVQYHITQSLLKKLYPSGFIAVYRGVANSGKTIKRDDVLVDVKSSSLESWTTDASVADRFARNHVRSGVVLKANIPITSIWASYHSNIDLHAQGEDEVIVLGNHKVFRAQAITQY